MTYQFQSRLDRLGARMKQINYESIQITNGAHTDEIAEASPIFTNEKQFLGEQIVNFSRKEFAVDVADLVYFSPDDCNLIPGLIIIRDTTGERFRIASYGHDDNCYRYTTSSRLRVIINCVQVS